MEDLRRLVRARLVANLGAAALDPFSPGSGRTALVRREIEDALEERGLEACLADLLIDEFTGLGPLQPLMEDTDVTDILVNRHDEIFVERGGRLERTAVTFRDQAHLEQVIHKLVAMVGREMSLDRPLVDARLADGSRANAVGAPVGGPTLCIRKFNRLWLDLAPRDAEPGGDDRRSDWVTEGGLTAEMARFLAVLARCRANLLVAGATGSGKSTLLRSVVAAMPPGERVITIEDTAELELTNPHWVRLEVVHGGEAGTDSGQRRLSVADLVQNSLRMRPDRLVIGEIRHGREALATLEALNTGHDGSATTIHASGARDALARLELLVARDFAQLQASHLRGQIARAFDVVAFITRTRTGRRVVQEIAEVLGVDADGEYRLRTLFAAAGESDSVATSGMLSPLGPRLQGRLAAAGEVWG